MTRRERSRDDGGRYAREIRCDACGKPVRPDDYATDDEVCGATDGPGFYLCHRARCPANEMGGWTVEKRRAFYKAQRASNEGRTS